MCRVLTVGDAKQLMGNLLSAKELAERLDRSPRTIQRWASKKLIPCVILGGRYYFDYDRVLEFAKVDPERKFRTRRVDPAKARRQDRELSQRLHEARVAVTEEEAEDVTETLLTDAERLELDWQTRISQASSGDHARLLIYGMERALARLEKQQRERKQREGAPKGTYPNPEGF